MFLIKLVMLLFYKRVSSVIPFPLQWNKTGQILILMFNILVFKTALMHTISCFTHNEKYLSRLSKYYLKKCLIESHFL